MRSIEYTPSCTWDSCNIDLWDIRVGEMVFVSLDEELDLEKDIISSVGSECDSEGIMTSGTSTTKR